MGNQVIITQHQASAVARTPVACHVHSCTTKQSNGKNFTPTLAPPTFPAYSTLVVKLQHPHISDLDYVPNPLFPGMLGTTNNSGAICTACNINKTARIVPVTPVLSSPSPVTQLCSSLQGLCVLSQPAVVAKAALFFRTYMNTFSNLRCSISVWQIKIYFSLQASIYYTWARASIWCSRIGLFPNSTKGFGSESVNGRSRVPNPPTRIRAFIWCILRWGMRSYFQIISAMLIFR